MNSDTVSNKYVVVTPVCNEAQHIVPMIESVMAQTVAPEKWVIVDDGSTDNTAILIDGCINGVPWVKVIHRARKNRPSLEYGEEYEAFLSGATHLEGMKWRYLAKTDGDLVLEPNYFENLVGILERNPRLGIVSGSQWELSAGKYRLQRAIGNSAWGAARIYRRDCISELQAIAPALGWDMAHILLARSLGWDTEAYLRPRFFHQRRMGSRAGTLRGNYLYGRTSYILGYSMWYFLLRLFYHGVRPPLVLGAFAMLKGYIEARINRMELVVDNRMKTELCKLQRRALWRFVTFERSLNMGHIQVN